jgi:hypothetical protein
MPVTRNIIPGMWVGIPERGTLYNSLVARTEANALGSYRAVFTRYPRRLAFLVQMLGAREIYFGFEEEPDDDEEEDDEEDDQDYLTKFDEFRDRVTQEAFRVHPTTNGDLTLEQALTSVELDVGSAHHCYFKSILDKFRTAFERLQPFLWEIRLGSAMYGAILMELDHSGNQRELYAWTAGPHLAGGGGYPAGANSSAIVDDSDLPWQANDTEDFYIPSDKLLRPANPDTGGWNDDYFEAMSYVRGWNNFLPDAQILSEFNSKVGTLPARVHNVSLAVTSSTLTLQQLYTEYITKLAGGLQANPIGSGAFWSTTQPPVGTINWSMTHQTGVAGAWLDGHIDGPQPTPDFPHWGHTTLILSGGFISFQGGCRRFGWQANPMGQVWNGSVFDWFVIKYGRVPSQIRLRGQINARAHISTFLGNQPLPYTVNFFIAGYGRTWTPEQIGSPITDEDGIRAIWPSLVSGGGGTGLTIPAGVTFPGGTQPVVSVVSFDVDVTNTLQNVTFPLFLGLCCDPNTIQVPSPVGAVLIRGLWEFARFHLVYPNESFDWV